MIPAEKNEQVARLMRDAVYESNSGDENWRASRPAWLKTLSLFTAALERNGMTIVETKLIPNERTERHSD